jgi:hypothetical protein
MAALMVVLTVVRIPVPRVRPMVGLPGCRGCTTAAPTVVLMVVRTAAPIAAFDVV